MANRHIKTINGKKYYYQSIRKGKKVTSKYIGPVESVDAKEVIKHPQEGEKPVKEKRVKEADVMLPEDSYIG